MPVAEAAKPVVEPPKYKPPFLYRGEPVYYWPGGDSKSPVLGWAMEIGDLVISICFMIPDKPNVWTIHGVRHKADPDRKPEDPSGFWDYSPFGKMLHHIESELVMDSEPKKK